MLAFGWLWLGWPRRHNAEWRSTTGLAIAVGAAVLATWLGWAIATYGMHSTFFSNTSVTDRAPTAIAQLARVVRNFRDTFVPHFLRHFDKSLILQRSTWGRWRDWFFQCYQLNLLLACGSVAWVVVLRELARAGREATGDGGARRRFWIGFVSGIIFLGIATHAARDEWGLTHISLQALVLLALAFLAARWAVLGRGWRIALLVGGATDFIFGIALHFGVQSYALDRWFAPDRSPNDNLRSYTEIAFMNLVGKIQNQLEFFGDRVALPAWGIALGLVLVLAFAVRRALVPPRGERATHPTRT